MSKLEKGDIVIYGKEKYKVASDVRSIYYGEHSLEKVTIESEKGDKFWVSVKDLKKDEPIKRLDTLIKEAINKDEKEMKANEKEQAEMLRKTQQKVNEKTKAPKTMSFTVITRDYVNGATNGYRPKETVITGQTKDGTKFEASVYGKNMSKETLERIADSQAKSLDLTEARLSKAAAQDKINMMLADNSADYVVFYNGADVSALEFNDNDTIKEAENLEDFGDMYPEDNGTDSRSSLADLVKEARNSDVPSYYSSESYDSPEEELDDLMALSGIENITER